MLVVDIHQRHDVLGLAEGQVGFSFATAANARDVQPVIGSEY
jgi:hypothetical protein